MQVLWKIWAYKSQLKDEFKGNRGGDIFGFSDETKIQKNGQDSGGKVLGISTEHKIQYIDQSSGQWSIMVYN